MLPVLENILKGIKASEIVESALEILSTLGIETTDWSPTGPERAIIEANAYSIEKSMSQYIADVAASGYGKYAKGDWLDLLFESNYDEKRIQGVRHQRKLLVTNTTGSPITISTARSLLVNPKNPTLVFSNVSPITVGAFSNVQAIFEAELTGSKYNVGYTNPWDFTTPIVGLTIGDLPGVDTVVSGSDTETDAQYYARVIAKWATVGAGATDGFFRYYALKASSEVKKVKIAQATPLPADVTLYLASATGPASPGAVTAVQNSFVVPGRIPQNFNIYASSASVLPVAIEGTVTALSNELNQAKISFENAILLYQQGLDIGAAKISRERIIQLIMQGLSAHPTNDLTLTSPPSDVIPGPNQVVVFDYSGLNWLAA